VNEIFRLRKVIHKLKNGDRVGTEFDPKEKGANQMLANPLISMVGQDRIELSTHGFSVRCSTD
jgi:hypothetical protein